MSKSTKRRVKRKNSKARANVDAKSKDNPILFDFNEIQKSFDSPWPEARICHRIVADEQFIYLIGGTRVNSANYRLYINIWRFSKATRAWAVLKTTGDKPEEFMCSPCVFLLNSSTLLVYGGMCPHSVGDSVTNKMYICDLNTLIWRQEKYTNAADDDQLPPKASGQAMIADTNQRYLYVIGGCEGAKYNLDVHRYDLQTKIWVQLAKTDEYIKKTHFARASHGIALWEKKLYIFGGHNAANEKASCCHVSVFDLQTRKWDKILTNMQGIVAMKSDLEENGVLFVERKNETVHPDIEAILKLSNLSISDNRAEEQSSLHHILPKARSFHSVAQFDSMVYITGGITDKMKVNNDFWSLDLATLSWSLLGKKLPTKMMLHSMAISADGQLSIFGGQHLVSETNKLYLCWVKMPTDVSLIKTRPGGTCACKREHLNSSSDEETDIKVNRLNSKLLSHNVAVLNHCQH